tara:strand:- start:58 stop:549 length:492 start_codon:yes stop_codon:yes gene_type:complete
MASTLKVNTIQHTGGTSALTIDSTGRVLTPARPMFYATMSAGTAANNVVKFDIIEVNVGSCYSAATGRFTSSVTGHYFFSFNVLSDNDGTDAYGEVRVRKNGTTYSNCTYRTELDNDFFGICTGIVNLPSGEYIDCFTTLKAYGGGNDADLKRLTHASVFLLG